MEADKECPGYVRSLPRWERYSLAGKLFKFWVYRFTEGYVLLSFGLTLLLPWIGTGGLHTFVVGNIFVVICLAFFHYGSVAAEKPWLPAAAAFESFILWAIYNWVLSKFIVLPYVWVFCIFVFVIRFWQRGEREVNAKAVAALLEAEKSRESSSDAH